MKSLFNAMSSNYIKLINLKLLKNTTLIKINITQTVCCNTKTRKAYSIRHRLLQRKDKHLDAKEECCLMSNHSMKVNSHHIYKKII